MINAITMNQSNRTKTCAISGLCFGLVSEQQELQLYKLIFAVSSYSYDLPSAGLFYDNIFALFSIFLC